MKRNVMGWRRRDEAWDEHQLTRVLRQERGAGSQQSDDTDARTGRQSWSGGAEAPRIKASDATRRGSDMHEVPKE